VIRIQIADGTRIAVAEIPSAFGPAGRSAINELRNLLGERLAGAHQFTKEDALTRAVAFIGAFAGALNGVIPQGDRDYE
jgi:hypothetical protein